jgi:hypothetical protein
MRFAFLVAWREYVENARTKGFWLGILLVPVIIFFSVQVPIWLEKKGTPTRHFVLVDPSNTLAPVIEAKLERLHEGQVLSALTEYAQKYAEGAVPKLSVEQFMSQGGQSNYLAQLESQLRPGAPPFKAPRRGFQRVAVPSGVSALLAGRGTGDMGRPIDFARGGDSHPARHRATGCAPEGQVAKARGWNGDRILGGQPGGYQVAG